MPVKRRDRRGGTWDGQFVQERTPLKRDKGRDSVLTRGNIANTEVFAHPISLLTGGLEDIGINA